jgi:hypothetical protein
VARFLAHLLVSISSMSGSDDNPVSEHTGNGGTAGIEEPWTLLDVDGRSRVREVLIDGVMECS